MLTTDKSSVHQTAPGGREARVSTQLRVRPSLMDKARRIADREGIFIGRVIEWALEAMPEDETRVTKQ